MWNDYPFAEDSKNKRIYSVLFSLIRISGFAEDTAARPLDFSRLYFSLKNKNKKTLLLLFCAVLAYSYFGFAEDTVARQ